MERFVLICCRAIWLPLIESKSKPIGCHFFFKSARNWWQGGKEGRKEGGPNSRISVGSKTIAAVGGMMRCSPYRGVDQGVGRLSETMNRPWLGIRAVFRIHYKTLRLTVFWSWNNLSQSEPEVLFFWKWLAKKNMRFFDSELIKSPRSLLAGVIYKTGTDGYEQNKIPVQTHVLTRCCKKEWDPKALARRDIFNRTSGPGFDTKLLLKFRIGSWGVGFEPAASSNF